MPSNNNSHVFSKSEDDTHDSLDAGTATPSGIATPRPDPADKRLPGIMHGYFGQVGESSTTVHRTSDRSALTTPPVEEEATGHPPSHVRPFQAPGYALLTAPGSPTQDGQCGTDHPLHLLSHEHLAVSRLAAGPALPPSSLYPTPPISSPPSFTQKEREGIAIGAVSRPIEGLGAGRPPLGRQQSATDVMPLRTHRHKAGPKSLSGIITDVLVHAAHISNPTTARAFTTPSTPTYTSSPVSALSSMTMSYLELAKLTENVALSPRPKNTPPHTPRALSHDTAAKRRNGPIPISKSTQSPPDDTVFTTSEHGPADTDSSDTFTIPPESLPTGPSKGKLFVSISEARGLRPSYDPYVVCVFEWNEYISKGPKLEDSDDDAKSREDALGGMPIKKSVSDLGRSIAIPMKSRQSSTTSLSDQKTFKSGRQVTNPKWEHQATL